MHFHNENFSFSPSNFFASAVTLKFCRMSSKSHLSTPYSEGWAKSKFAGLAAVLIETFVGITLFLFGIPLAIFGYLSDRFMHFLFGRFYIYNVSWEDPRIETNHVKFGEKGLSVLFQKAFSLFSFYRRCCFVEIVLAFVHCAMLSDLCAFADRILTIASAGDNVLDYVISGAHVTAVDLNDCQLALT